MDKWNDEGITMVPRWLRISGIVLRVLLTILPFVMAGGVMIFGQPPVLESNLDGVWQALWFLSLLQLINLVDIDYK